MKILQWLWFYFPYPGALLIAPPPQSGQDAQNSHGRPRARRAMRHRCWERWQSGWSRPLPSSGHGRWWNSVPLVQFLDVRVYLFRLYAVSVSGLLWVWFRFWLCLWLWFKLVLTWVVIGPSCCCGHRGSVYWKNSRMDNCSFLDYSCCGLNLYLITTCHTSSDHIWPTLSSRPSLWTPGTFFCRDRPSYLALHLGCQPRHPSICPISGGENYPKRKVTGPRYEKLQLRVTKQKCSRLAAGNHNHPFAAKP